MDTIENVIAAVEALATVAAAFIAALAAREARNATREARNAVIETRRASQVQIVGSLLDAYAELEILTAIKMVESWNEKRITPDSEIDRARRRVAHHFQKIAHFAKSKLLDEDMLRIVATKEQVALYCQVIEPMENQINPDYDRSSFDILADLYGGRPQLPPLFQRGGTD
jgi:hypothetical protein